MKKKLVWLSGFSAVLGLVAPFLASAQAQNVCTQAIGTTTSTVFELLCRFQLLLNAVVPFLVALGAIYFIWGVVQYVIASEEEAKKKGRNRMIYGLIGLVIILAFWGFVRIIVKTINPNDTTVVPVPCLPGTVC